MSRVERAVPRMGRLLLGAGSGKEVMESLARLAPVLSRHEAARLFSNPVVGRETLRSALADCFPGIDESVLECALILARERQPRLLRAVLRWVERTLRNSARVSVRSAVPLTPGQRDRLLDIFRLDSAAGSLEEEIDPSLIGGIMVRKGWRRWDFSLAGAINRTTGQKSGR